LRAGKWRDLLLAAVLPTLGACFRPDLYAFLFVLLLVAAWKSPRSKIGTAALFASTAVAALVPLWLFQRATIGSPFGFHVETLFSSTSGIAKHIATRPIIFYSLFVRSSATVWLSPVLSAPFLILFVVNPKLPARRFRYALPLAGLAALAASFFIYRCFLGSHQLIACLGRSNSLFPAAPLLILGLMRCRDAARPAQVETARSAIWLLALAYAIVYGLAAPEMSKWGIHWGNRYLLVLYPMLAALAAINIADWQSIVTGEASQAERPASRMTTLSKRSLGGKIIVVALIVASLAAQILSLNILHRKMDFSLRLNQEVAKRPEQVIITDRWWLGQELYSQFYRRLIFLATSTDQYRDLTQRLLEHGYTKVLFAAPPVPGERPEPGTIQVTDRGLGYWNLRFFPVELGPN
jgi:hypothetical protein